MEPHPQMMTARTEGDEFLMFPVLISNYEDTNKVTTNNVFLHREKLYKLYPYRSYKTPGKRYLNLATENAPKRKHTHVKRLCCIPLKQNQSRNVTLWMSVLSVHMTLMIRHRLGRL